MGWRRLFLGNHSFDPGGSRLFLFSATKRPICGGSTGWCQSCACAGQQVVAEWHAWRRALRAAARMVQGGGGQPRRRWWPLRWGGLSPEQQVRYLYFQMLDQAAGHDQPRRASETPGAFAPRLSQAFATQEEEERHPGPHRRVCPGALRRPTGGQRAGFMAGAGWARLRKVFTSKPQ